MKRVLAGLAAVAVLAVCGQGVANAGTGWTIQPVPMPSFARNASLAGVSCWSKTGCIAVGRYCHRKHCIFSHALAEEWNGSAWTVQHLRRARMKWQSGMSGVSCVSARSCIAVGMGFNGVEHWNGSAWAIQPIKTPADAGTSLNAVSCTAAARCTAVGALGRDGKELPLAERWDGRAWAIQRTAIPPGSAASYLTAVSCSAADSCMAVGTSPPLPFRPPAPGTPLAESWDGSSWTLQAIPEPPGSAGTLMTGLSCASAANCAATGEYFTQPAGGGPLVSHALAESWNGTAWTIQPVPVSGGQSKLTAVSCVSPASCTAVGYDVRGGLAEYWNGSVWRQQQTTHPAGHNWLYGVSCLFPRACTAVGLVRRPGSLQLRLFTPLAEQE